MQEWFMDWMKHVCCGCKEHRSKKGPVEQGRRHCRICPTEISLPTVLDGSAGPKPFVRFVDTPACAS